MNNIVTITGAFITLFGSIFLLLGSAGILRMPDVFTRIQAGTKASTLGAMLTLTGLALVHPAWTGKLVLLTLFILVTNPVSSHMLARAAHHIRTTMSEKTVTDKLRLNSSPLTGETPEEQKVSSNSSPFEGEVPVGRRGSKLKNI